jgi:hypothetical protein
LAMFLLMWTFIPKILGRPNCRTLHEEIR